MGPFRILVDIIRRLRLDLVFASIWNPSRTQVIARIHLALKDIPTEIADGLTKIDPESVSYGSFRCHRPAEDKRVRQVLEYLQIEGFSPWAGRKKYGPRDFSLDYERIYARKDLISAHSLVLDPDDYARGATRDGSGLLRLDPSRKVVSTGGGEYDLTQVRGIFMADDGTVVTDKLRQALQAAGLKGLAFRPVESTSGALPVPFWELTSDIDLPPMSSECKFYDAIDGHEVTHEYEGPFVMREGADFPEFGFRPPEPKYDFDALAKAGAFDLSRSFEQFTTPASRLLIASQKFRRVCEKQGLRLEWIPVRLVS